MTAMYRTKVTATFEIEVEAASSDQAARIVDGVIDSKPTICVVEINGTEEIPLEVALASCSDDVLYSRPSGLTIVRGSMHRRLA